MANNLVKNPIIDQLQIYNPLVLSNKLLIYEYIFTNCKYMAH